LYVRSILIQDNFTARLLSLLTERFLLNFADIVVSILANLIGLLYKKKIEISNIRTIVKMLAATNWIPEIAQ